MIAQLAPNPDLATCTTDDIWKFFRHKQLMQLNRGGIYPLTFRIVSLHANFSNYDADTFKLITEQETSRILDYWQWTRLEPTNIIRVLGKFP